MVTIKKSNEKNYYKIIIIIIYVIIVQETKISSLSDETAKNTTELCFKRKYRKGDKERDRKKG